MSDSTSALADHAHKSFMKVIVIRRVRHPFWDTMRNGTSVLRRARADCHHSYTVSRPCETNMVRQPRAGPFYEEELIMRSVPKYIFWDSGHVHWVAHHET